MEGSVNIMQKVCRTMRLGSADLAVAILLVAGAVAWAQGPASNGTTKPQMMAKDADPDWEVATVRPSNPDEQTQDVRTLGRHMLIHRQTVEALLRMGYGLQKSQIVGAPEWVKTEEFDADGLADAEGEPSVRQVQSLVRKLLAERFGVKAHREQREMSVFALTVAKNGPKLTPAKGDRFSGGQQNPRTGEGYRTIGFKDTSMQDLATMLMQYVDRPIVDKTGLKGPYDFTLKYTYDESVAPVDGTAPPSLFTAMQEQLGLKLDPVRAPADVLVVDSVERPGAN